MLSKTQRLRKEEVSATVKKGSVKYGEYFSFRKNITKKDKNRFAVVVSKKVATDAVTRNTLRRKVYAFLKEHIQTPSSGGVIFVKKSIYMASKEGWQKDLYALIY